jgi:hypothetical protein
MGRFHPTDEQGRLELFPNEQKSVTYYEFSGYINIDLWIEFINEFAPLSKDVTKYECGLFYLVKCFVTNNYEASKIVNKYFTYPNKLTKH